MDKKFYQVKAELICPHCKSDDIYILGGNVEIGTIVKCLNCGEIMPESELEEKNESGRENYDNLS